MTNELTIENVEAAVLELADAHPDAVYQRNTPESACHYISGPVTETDGTVVGEGCIFGQALLELGVEEEDLEGEYCEAIDELDLLNFPVPPYWITAQEAQDLQRPWNDVAGIIREEQKH